MDQFKKFLINLWIFGQHLHTSSAGFKKRLREVFGGNGNRFAAIACGKNQQSYLLNSH